MVKSATNSTKITVPGVSFDSLAKSSNGWSGLFGTPFTWTISARARGNDTANTLTITDPLSAAFVPQSINPGFGDVTTEVYVSYQTRKNPVWTTLAGSPFTTTNSTSANSLAVTLTSVIAAGDIVTNVQWIYTNVTPLFTFQNSGDVKPTVTGYITNVDLNGLPVGPGASITNIASLAATHGGTNLNLGSVTNWVTLAPPAPYITLSEATSAGNPAQPGQTNTWSLKIGNNSTQSSDNFTNGTIADLLPASLQYVPGSASGGATHLALTNVVVTTNCNGSGRTLLKLQYSGYLSTNSSTSTTLKTYVNPGVAPGTISNSCSLVGWGNSAIQFGSPLVADTNNLAGIGIVSNYPTVSGTLTMTAAAAANSVTMVKGQLDSVYKGYPQYGSSYPGGPFTYQETVSNPGNITLTNITVIDILPFVGDSGVQATNQSRGSAWQPFLTGPVCGPSGVTVYYSTSPNPYRPEILGTNTPGSAADWTTAIPSDLTTVHALKFAFGPTNVLNPLDSIQLTWALQVPGGAPTNTFAYNSFAYTATPAMTNNSAFISEPNKVGILALPQQPAFIGDYVWNDLNLNGLQDAGEPGMNGVRVELYVAGPSRTAGASDNTLVEFAITANSPSGTPGYYQFPFLAPTNYFVKVIPPATYSISPEYLGSNSNLNSRFNPANGWSDLVILGAAGTNESVDCGLYYNGDASVGDYVWIDRNANGIQDEGSIDGLNGVIVQLYAVNATATNLYSSTATAFDSFGNPGYYHFYNVPPGQYQLRFMPPAGDTFTIREANGPNSGNGSEANSAGWTSVFTLTGGMVNNAWDAGIVLPSGPLSVGRMVWYDSNADGRYDFFGGEPGINNVIVSLYWDTDNNGVFTPGVDQLFSTTLTTTLAGEPGNYSFNNLPPGNFVVVLEAYNFQPGGALHALTNDLMVVPVAPAYVDNLNKGSPVGAYVASTAFPMSAGTEPTTPNSNLVVDFGLTSPTNFCSVGSTVFLDTNANGQQDSGEAGIAGVGVQLWRLGPSAVVGGSDAVLLMSTNTDSNGNYIFAYLPPTNYFIEIPTPPATAPEVSPVLYTGNQKDLWNHGTQPAGFGTAVFTPAIVLAPGAQPTNFVTSGRGATLAAGLPGGAANGDMTEDFGLWNSSGLVALGNTVFNDLNANGVQDAGEPGLPGVGIALAQILNNVSNVVAYAITDTNGHYVFNLLSPTNYQVVVLATNFQSGGPLTNFVSSPGVIKTLATGALVEDHGQDDANAVQDGIHSGVYTLTVGGAPSGQVFTSPVQVPATNAYLTLDLGFTPTYSLGNRVWADNGAGGGVMNNGVQDGAEPGLAGVVLKLFAADGSGNPTGVALATNLSDALGYYRFDGLLTGTYVVVVDTVSSGTALGGMVSSAGWDTTLLVSDDQMDHGIDLALGVSSVLPGGIASVPVTLGAGLQPAGELDLGGASPNPPRGHGPAGDANDNLVLDFGFAPACSISQSVVAISQPAATAGASQVAVGATVTYGLVIGLPEGALSGLTVADQLPAGMQYVSSQVITASLGSSNLLAANFPGTLPSPGVTGTAGSGALVTWTFGGLSVPGIVPTNIQYFVIFITAQVLNVAGNVGLGAPTVLVNTATCTAPGNPAAPSAPVSLTVVEPAVALAKAMSPGATDAGGLVTVTLVATNSGTAAALSVNLQDVLNPTDFDLTTITLGTSGVNYPAAFSASYSQLTGTVLYSGGTIAPGSSATLTFTAKLAAAVVAGSTHTNSAAVTQVSTLSAGGGRVEPGAAAAATISVYTHSVGGYAYADANNNGVKDAGETGLGGATITLAGTNVLSHVVSLTTTTAVDGSYLFTNLAPGTYTLTRASIPVGYLGGKQAAGTGFGGTPNNASASATISGLSIAGGSSSSGAGYNFGLILPTTLTGLVFSDQNNDGVLNGVDFGISNVVVTLGGTSDWGVVSNTTLTLANGTYAFTGIRPGTYTITETQPAAFGQGRNVLGNLGGANTATDVFSGISLTQGQSGGGYNFAELPAAITGVVFADRNYNQALDAGEGLGGIPVVLTGTNLPGGSVSLTNITAAGGAYGFSNLLAGYYTLRVQSTSLPAAMIQDVDPDGIPDSSTAGSLAPGGTIAAWNFGYYQLVTIGGYVWNDANADGIQDVGEPGMAGVILNLTGTAGNGTPVNATTNTDAGGHYYFAVPPGTYGVAVVTPPAMTLSPANQGTRGLDSLPTPSATAPATLSGGASDLTIDFGFYLAVTIGNFVWNDANGDGIQNDGSGSGLVGVGLTLIGTNAAGVVLTNYTTSDATGHYTFAPAPGAYTVIVAGTNFNPGGPLAGFVPTVTGLNPGSVGSPASVVLAEGQTSLALNFGYYQPVTIGSYVWNDANANGLQDAGEQGLAGATLTLAGTSGSGAVINTTTNTDAGGHYYFTAPPGSYTVSVSPPAGYTATLANQGSRGHDSLPTPSATVPAPLAGAGSDLTLDFGFYQTVTIGDYVWNDANGDGIQNDGAASGLGNVGLMLVGTNLAGAVVTNYTSTAGTGAYQFTEPPGTYVVTVLATNFNTGGPLAGYVATVSGRGTAGTGSAGSPASTTLSEGQTSLALNFGYYQPVTIGSYVWDDLNEDGVQDDGASGLPGVGLTMVGTNAAGTVVADHTTTDATGHYAFSEAPGAYSVSVDATNFSRGGPLADLIPTASGKGTPATGSRASPATTVLVEAASDQTLNFGYYRSDPYRTQANGDWSNPAIWQRYDGFEWTNATVPPSYTDGNIQVMASNTVTISGSVVADQMEVDGQLIIQAGGTLTVVSNTTPGMSLTGSLTNLGTVTLGQGSQVTVTSSGVLVNSGTVNSAAGALTFAGGTYVHAFTTNGGVIPQAIWLSSTNVATCQITGYTTDTAPPAGLGQPFLNFVWNCPGQTGNIDLGAGFTSVDNFTVAGTGTGRITLGAGLTVTNQTRISGGADLDCGTNPISGGGFTLADGATLGIGSPGGIDASGTAGNILTTNNSFSPTANYVYDGTAPQSAGSGLPPTVNSLTINNAQGTVTLSQPITVATIVAMQPSAQMSLPTGTTSTTPSFVVGGIAKASGSWGAGISPARHHNDVWFSPTTGMLNVSVGVPSAFSGLTSGQVIIYGTPNLLLSGTVSAATSLYPANGEAVTVTIDGVPQTAAIAGGGGGFSLNFPSGWIQHSNSVPHTITYSYAGDDNLNAVADASTSVQVQAAGLTVQAAGDQKPYGTARAYGPGSTNFTATGLANGETIGSVTITATGGTNASAPVGGTYTLIPSQAAGGTANTNNYALSYAAGQLTVTAAPLTATVTLNNKAYDGTTNAATIVTRQLAGVMGSDDVNLGTSGSVGGFPSRNAGPYSAIAVTGLRLSGTTAPNYSLVASNITATALITPRALTLTAGTNDKAYDGTITATNVPVITAGSLAPGDTAGFNTTYDTPNVGKGKTLTPGGAAVDGNNGANYGYTFLASQRGEIDAAATQLKLVSSSPTNGYRAGVFFTATNLHTDASGTVVFSANGAAFGTNPVSAGGAVSLTITNLPRGATNNLLASYSGNGNYLASSASLIQVITNHPPVAADVYYVRTAGTLLRIFWSQLGTNWTDVDGDTITNTGINLSSTNGVVVATNSLQILYPAAAPNVNDRLSYTIRDSYGGTNTGWIDIVVNPFVTGLTLTPSRTTPDSVTFYGHPGYTYVLQRSTNIFNQGGWVTISTNTISASGQGTVVDTFPDLSGVVPAGSYYRLGWSPSY